MKRISIIISFLLTLIPIWASRGTGCGNRIFTTSKSFDIMERIKMLRSLRHYRDNNLSIAKASTDGMLDLGSDAPPQREYDFLETDYR